MGEIPEPSGLGHELLTEWGIYAENDRDGRESWSVKPRVDPGYHGDPPDRWYVVNRIVSQRARIDGRKGYTDFYRLVSRFYLGSKSYSMIQKDLNKPEWWVKSMLVWACETTKREFVDVTT